MRLKNSKATGSHSLSAELFKNGCNELVGRTHQLIYKIWFEESMPKHWNLSGLCPALKKDSLIPIAYKVVTGVLCERLNTDWTLSVRL